MTHYSPSLSSLIGIGIAWGGACWVVAALLTLRVRDRGAEKEISKPESWAAPVE